jgi:hypothetical protein
VKVFRTVVLPLAGAAVLLSILLPNCGGGGGGGGSKTAPPPQEPSAPPVVSPQYDDSATLLGDIPRSLFVLNNDPAGYELESVTSPRQGTVAIEGSAIRYTPPKGFAGTESFTYVARKSSSDALEATVRLEIVAVSAADLLVERVTSEPDTAANVWHSPRNATAEAARELMLESMREDPWLARGLLTVEAAVAARRPVDLYVVVGDELMQGVTETGKFNAVDDHFSADLDDIWDTTPDQSNANAILVLNCAIEDTSIVQWSDLTSPRESLPIDLGNEHGANLSEDCMFFLDRMLRDTRIPVALQGLIVGFGAADALRSAAEPQILQAWPAHLRRLVDLYRAAYGTNLALTLVVPPEPVDRESNTHAAWQEMRNVLRQHRTYNMSLVETTGLDTWQRNGQTLLSNSGQRGLATRLATAAHQRWVSEFQGIFEPVREPVLGTVGECSRQTPCFPGTEYLIEPKICEQRDLFRANAAPTSILCDQYGNSLHALAAGCNHCIDLEHIAGNLGVALVKGKTGMHFQPGPFMAQSIDGTLLGPLPYQNPHVIEAPRPCGYFDRESSTFVVEPGSYLYRVESRANETCNGDDPAACGLLLSPESALRDTFQHQLTVAAGECRELLVQEQSGEILTCGQQITRDTVLGGDMHCPEKLMDGLWIVEDGVTLDLNGYTIFGRPSPGFDQYGPSTAIKVHANNVTVTNGVIEGWDTGIFVEQANRSGFIARTLSVRNLDVEDADHQLFGVQLPGVQGGLVEDTSFEFISKFHADGIGTGGGDIVARRIWQRGGAAAMLVGGYYCDHEQFPSRVELYDSIVRDAFLSSLFLQCIEHATVRDNEFSWTTVPTRGAPAGLAAHASGPGAVIGLDISRNFIHGAVTGLSFDGVQDSRADDNYIIDSVHIGLRMGHSLLCEHQENPGSHPLPDWFECFGASGNLVENNWVTSKWSSLTDLYENPKAHDNTWRDNVCETVEGPTVPPCVLEPD